MGVPGQGRAGHYVQQAQGYRAFIPQPLPPQPPVTIDSEMWQLLSQADRALGRLDGSTITLPDPDLFVYMYVRKEAVLSSQIEGTQASLMDLLEFEAEGVRPGRPKDVTEVVNYVAAMNYGLDRLKALPLSLRLIREIHAKLLQGVRGSEWSPGEFRHSQNWVAPPGTPLSEASYVPPPPHEMQQCLSSLEQFLIGSDPMPLLIKIGLAHCQFETIHPFLDGNGRVGRLMITFLLCVDGVLQRPLLYLSHYLKQNRGEYYARLQAVRDRGEWEAWLKFFLRGVFLVAQEACTTARQIARLHEVDRDRLTQGLGRGAARGLLLLESLYHQPIVSVEVVGEVTGLTYPNANALVGQLVDMGLLTETTGRKRNRRFAYAPYLALFAESD
ncbi:MAG: Fic family protein [Anaerolineae bacterium]